MYNNIMKNHIIIFPIILFTAILFTIMLFAVTMNNDIEEGFTPGVRRFYRPYVRRARIVKESFSTNHLSNMFRKLGII